MNNQNGNSIIIIHPPFNEYNFGSKWKENPSMAAPLGPLYLASPLIKAGYKVSFIDLNVDKLEREEYRNYQMEFNF